MSKTKRYFRTEDDSFCYDKEHFVSEMKAENLEQIEVFEAVKANDPDHIWCSYISEAGEKGNCGKQCDAYKPRNGIEGACVHLGTLYNHGEKVMLTISKIQ